MFSLFSAKSFSEWLIVLLGFLSVSFGGMLNIGCSANQEPLERATNRGFDLADKAFETAIHDTNFKTLQFSSGAHVNSPEYHMTFGGYLVNGFRGEASIQLKGVDGDLRFAGQADNETLPAASEPATEETGG